MEEGEGLAAMSRQVVVASAVTARAAILATSCRGLLCFVISFSLFCFLCFAIACFLMRHVFAMVRCGPWQLRQCFVFGLSHSR